MLLRRPQARLGLKRPARLRPNWITEFWNDKYERFKISLIRIQANTIEIAMEIRWRVRRNTSLSFERCISFGKWDKTLYNLKAPKRLIDFLAFSLLQPRQIDPFFLPTDEPRTQVLFKTVTSWVSFSFEK
jgi:hypothetical protein